jgi:GNAT superfamily N-acetyltransferase
LDFFAFSPKVRTASPSEARSLYALRARAIRVIEDFFYSPEQRRAWIRAITPEQLILDMRSGELACVLIAELHGNKAGFAWLRDDIVWGVYVEPSKRRLGVGSVLLRAIENQARLWGQAALWVSASNNSVGFYRANGYEPRSPFRFDIPSRESRVGLEAVEMQKVLISTLEPPDGHK